MDLHYLNQLLAALPAYVKVALTLDNGRVTHLLARELPGKDRRFTNTDTGTEWFIPFTQEQAFNLGLVSVEVETFKVEVRA